MQFWDTIINTAMMGTDKKEISIVDVVPELESETALIYESQLKDKEEKFLQLASLAFNYRQCGVLPACKEIRMPLAPAEEKLYCNSSSIQVLKDIISEESIPLLKFWLQHCYEKQRVIEPDLVPVLLSAGVQHKKLQLMIASCCGKRGEWLAGFNSAWDFSSTQTGEELWQTGTFEQRKEILKQTRKTDPAKAREWVQQTWQQEDANTKTSLLELLSENIGENDLPFLESLSAEKSKKVKEEALQLLKQIPGSAILQQYHEIIKQGVSIKKEKTLLGLGNKTVLQFQLPPSLPESIFKSGIEKLSGQKDISDESFIFYQIIGYITPLFWETHLSSSPPEVIDLFKRSEEGKRMIPAIGNAVGKFRVASWATLFLGEEKAFYPDLVPLLDKKEREQYLLKFIDVDTMREYVIQKTLQEESEWGLDLAKGILKHAAKNPYQFGKTFYSQYIHLLPVQIVGELEKCTPAEDNLRTMWRNMSEYIIKLMTIKIQTIKAFNE